MRIVYLCVLALLLTGCSAVEKNDIDKTMNITFNDYATLGDPNAPVTLIEFSDYQCPFCKKFTTEIFPTIKEAYIDTGKVRFVFRDFPLEIHDLAKEAALAARCAGEQGQYFAYHDILFENSEEISTENLKAWAAELGLDTDLFSTCLNDPEQMKDLETDIAEAKELGVSGTPSFLINEHFITGAQPFAAFKLLIEAELDNTIILENSSDATCETNEDCDEAKTIGPYCSQTNSDELCTTTMTPTCELSGTIESMCVAIVTEECATCETGKTCINGVCV